MSTSALVIDSGVALSFAIQHEPLHAEAIALIKWAQEHQFILIAPTLFDYEVESVLRLKVFRHAIKAKNSVPFSEDEAEEARELIEALALKTLHERDWIKAAYAIARDYGQARAYDAAYAALAGAYGLDLWTADEDFYLTVNAPEVPSAKRLNFVHLLERGSTHFDANNGQ